MDFGGVFSFLFLVFSIAGLCVLSEAMEASIVQRPEEDTAMPESEGA